MMKSPSNFISKVVLAFILCALVYWLSGCRYAVRAGDYVGDVVTDVAMLGSGEEFARPGETEAECQRRMARIKRINRQEMLADIDKVLLLDKPSTLTDKRMH